MKVKTIKETEKMDRKTMRPFKRPAGTEVEHPKAYLLCMMGLAEPIDEECFAALEREGWKGLDRFKGKRPGAKTKANDTSEKTITFKDN